MFLISFSRILKFAWQNFWRNLWLSIVTITIMVLALLSISVLIMVNVLTNQAISSVQEKVDVSVYFKTSVTDDQIYAVRSKMESLSEVKEVEYISADNALINFKNKHANDPLVMETLTELIDNPLGASLIVRAVNIDDYPQIISELQQEEYQPLVQETQFGDYQKIISELTLISGKIKRVGLGITFLFILIAALVIFNTIRIAIYTHREEIGIMKLVGASNTFVRLPFLLESIFYAIISLIILMALLYPLLIGIRPYILAFFGDAQFDILIYFRQNLIKIFGLQFLVAIVLNIVSSSIAVGKYMKV